MSAGFTHALAEGLRYNGVEVTFEPGYLTRGNGYVFPNGRPDGPLIHHTGSEYDTGLPTLLNGRPDLSPPLCNSCGYANGRVHILAAHPTNNAGAGNGKNMGPHARTRLFNPRVWGHEIMFPGSRPMTAAQERSALILAGVTCGILGRGLEWVRLHHETSETGKWDAGAGRGLGIPYGGDLFRSRIWGALVASESQELGVDDMPAGTLQVGAEPVTFELDMPTGKASSLVHTTWVGASLSKGGRIEITAWRGRGDRINSWAGDVVPHERFSREMPDGAETYSVTVDSTQPGFAGWCIETRPRKDIAR